MTAVAPDSMSGRCPMPSRSAGLKHGFILQCVPLRQTWELNLGFSSSVAFVVRYLSPVGYL
jgi:hypothetical protein